MKSPQTPNLKTTALTKVMYAEICWYKDQAFDNMSEESLKKKKHFECFIVNKPLWPVPTQGIAEQANQNGELRPQQHK